MTTQKMYNNTRNRSEMQRKNLVVSSFVHFLKWIFIISLLIIGTIYCARFLFSGFEQPGRMIIAIFCIATSLYLQVEEVAKHGYYHDKKKCVARVVAVNLITAPTILICCAVMLFDGVCFGGSFCTRPPGIATIIAALFFAVGVNLIIVNVKNMTMQKIRPLDFVWIPVIVVIVYLATLAIRAGWLI